MTLSIEVYSVNNTVPQKIAELVKHNFSNVFFCVEYKNEYSFLYFNHFFQKSLLTPNVSAYFTIFL